MCAKNYEKILKVDKVITTNAVGSFLAHPVYWLIKIIKNVNFADAAVLRQAI